MSVLDAYSKVNDLNLDHLTLATITGSPFYDALFYVSAALGGLSLIAIGHEIYERRKTRKENIQTANEIVDSVNDPFEKQYIRNALDDYIGRVHGKK